MIPHFQQMKIKRAPGSPFVQFSRSARARPMRRLRWQRPHTSVALDPAFQPLSLVCTSHTAGLGFKQFSLNHTRRCVDNPDDCGSTLRCLPPRMLHSPSLFRDSSHLARINEVRKGPPDSPYSFGCASFLPFIRRTIFRYISSRCHLSPQRGRRRRNSLAYVCPNFKHHCRTVSEVTTIPRWASSALRYHEN